MRSRLLTITLLTLGAAGCATAPAPAPPVAREPVVLPLSISEEATILHMEDSRTWNPELSAQWMSHANAAHRERMAIALGRIGGANFDDTNGNGYMDEGELPAGVAQLVGSSRDPHFAVRRAVAFSLGEIGNAAAANALVELTGDEHADVASEAVEALSKLADPSTFDTVRTLTSDSREGVRLRAIRFLFRYPAELADPVASSLLGSSDAETRREAAYALSRRAVQSARNALVLTLNDADHLTRSYAARALGLLDDMSLVEPLMEALSDEHPWVRTNAARAIMQIVRDSTRVDRDTVTEDVFRLRTLLKDPDPGTRAVAIEALGPWLPLSEAARDAVVSAAAGGSAAEREIAAGVLARHVGLEEGSPVLALAETDEPWVRLRILEGAASDPAAAALRESWWSASEPLVRTAVLRTIPADSLESEMSLIRRGLQDPDVIVRATAIGQLAETKHLPTGEKVALMMESLERSTTDELNDARLAALAGLAATEYEGRDELLRSLFSDADPVVRRSAVEAAAELEGGRRAGFTPLPTRFTGDEYEQIAAWALQSHNARIETSRGPIVVALLTREAPITTWNFAQLANAGYFDGTSFMRVVPNFVIQGGDPRNDQSGGPGWAIRDEINMQKYTRGAMGMALSGPDTGGSQFFFVHSPQPHLDGGYTVFGRVIEGMTEVVDEVQRGDDVQSVRIVTQ